MWPAAGELRAPRAVRDLRDLTRLRKALIRERGHHVNRIEKTLELAQIKLGCVVTDLMGKTGRAILQALSTGIDDPDQLADYAQGLLRKKRAALREALAGRLTPHYAFLLQQHLALIDTLDAHIATLDARIDEAMRPFADAAALVQTMPGVAIRAAQAILAETGMDMVAFPRSAHFASWARLCPGEPRECRQTAARQHGPRRDVVTGDAARKRVGGDPHEEELLPRPLPTSIVATPSVRGATMSAASNGSATTACSSKASPDASFIGNVAARANTWTSAGPSTSCIHSQPGDERGLKAHAHALSASRSSP